MFAKENFYVILLCPTSSLENIYLSTMGVPGTGDKKINKIGDLLALTERQSTK